MARWSSPGYADLMVGTSSDVAFADAWHKGVRFDKHLAYEAALKNATAVPPVSNVGRKGLARSMYRGYADISVHEGMSWTLEGALNDFGLARFAEALALEEKDPAKVRRYRDEAAYFGARAADYVHLYDPATGFFRGRDASGQWRQPAAEFESREWGGDYTEANAWNFAFTAPHDAEGLASLMGGRDRLAQKLDGFFATPETAERRYAGSYKQVIHEMTEARDVRMGMYAHSNQPAHHIPWMYVAAGQPWKTQRIVRDVMGRLYLGSEIGQGYAGDEDNGEMSAWYTFAMLGLYPMRMGAPEYVIGSPAFARSEVTLENGRKLTVVARNNSPENVYVQSLRVNGKPWNQAWIRHADIAAGATLEFTRCRRRSRRRDSSHAGWLTGARGRRSRSTTSRVRRRWSTTTPRPGWRCRPPAAWASGSPRRRPSRTTRSRAARRRWRRWAGRWKGARPTAAGARSTGARANASTGPCNCVRSPSPRRAPTANTACVSTTALSSSWPSWSCCRPDQSDPARTEQWLFTKTR